MRKKLFLLGAIASIIVINSVFGDTTVTTKDYVDTNFQTKIPAGSFGENNSVVTYGANAGDVEERFILDYGSDQTHEANIKNYMANGNVTLSSDFVMQMVLNKTEEQLKNSLVPAKYIEYGLNAKQYRITPGTTGSVAIFNGADSRGGSQFTERAIYDGSTTYDSTTDADKLITAGAVDNKQNKMTCTRWLDTPENPDHTDENCLLWSITN